mmetsp:Transcript_19619/g.52793  ORF Transcript_19619/g.52793 Transcript_19619/m.52793 type:complete len:667 (+) Transcript_19619:121-2121(+)
MEWAPPPPPPPKPLSAGWLDFFGRFEAPLEEAREEFLPEGADAPVGGKCSLLRARPQDGEEEVFFVKRSLPFSSQLLGSQQRLLERECRFYEELAEVIALPDPDCLEADEVPADGRRELGVEGFYEVAFREVPVRTSASSSAMILCLLRRGDAVRGSAFTTRKGEQWIRLHVDSREELGLEKDRDVYVPVHGGRVGLGDLLRHRRGRPGPGREDWRHHTPSAASGAMPSTASTREATATASVGRTARCERRWRGLVLRRLAGAFRVPSCPASYWHGDWQAFTLVTERLSAPEWVRADTGAGCSEGQAAAVVEALGRFHRNFLGHGKIDGSTWLPVLPLHDERRNFLQDQYRYSFESVKGYLQSALSALAYETCEKLCDGYAEVAGRLSQPPLTLLHGSLNLAHLRFSPAESSPVVAATDWRLVCRGRGAYDFASFLASCGPPEVRRDMESWLMMNYLAAFGLAGGKQAKEEFEDDVRAALLANLAFTIAFFAGALEARPDSTSGTAHCSLLWVSEACDDWDAIRLLGGSDGGHEEEAQTRSTKAKKGARRKASPKGGKASRRKSVAPSKSPGRGGASAKSAASRSKSPAKASGKAAASSSKKDASSKSPGPKAKKAAKVEEPKSKAEGGAHKSSAKGKEPSSSKSGKDKSEKGPRPASKSPARKAK